MEPYTYTAEVHCVQQQEENRRKVELLRHETEESLKQLRRKPTSIRPVSRINSDVWSQIQHQVSNWLHASTPWYIHCPM